MPLDLDAANFAIAVAALWIAISESRRNNKAILKVVDVGHESKQSLDENQQQRFHQFRLSLRNCGVSLHGVEACLQFVGPAGYGTIRIPLRRVETRWDCAGEFAKGMVVEFGVKSYQLHNGSLRLLSLLSDFRKQDARICVFSQGYLVRQFKPGIAWEKFKMRWNHAVTRLNYGILSRRVSTAPEGHQIIKAYFRLPTFHSLLWAMTCFANSCRADAKAEDDAERSATSNAA